MILFMKILLAILIEYAVIMLCRTKVRFFRNRPKSLQQITFSLQSISNEMVFSNELLPSIINKMAIDSRPPIRVLWQGVNKKLKEHKSFEESFEEVLLKYQSELYLSDDDLSCLRLLASQLGQSDLENQLQILKITQNKIVENEAKSELEKKQQVKLWNTLGILGGLTIVILLW